MAWESVIGLEIHAQLATNSKIFSGASTAYGAEPNTQACAVDLGLPGVLPVLNSEVVRMAVKFGLAVNAEIGHESVFARKNYFYPDLPKGYQISQYELPIVGPGQISISPEEGVSKVIGITRAHLEEDAGKSLHDQFPNMTGIDLNRAGTPLLEIVSEPDMRSAREAVAYARKIHALVQFLNICDGNMQEGSFRCDANVSVRLKGEEKLGTRAELKNINSFRFLERAINFEIQRQIEVIEDGGEVVQETRLYDADKNETRSMRSKEEAFDYRYFPDPDLLPVIISAEDIEDIRSSLPELSIGEARKLLDGLKRDRGKARGVSWEELLRMPDSDFFRRRGVPAFRMVGVDGEEFADYDAYMKHLRVHLPESYLAGRDFRDYAETLRKVAAGDMTAEDGARQMPALRRVGGSCPCSKSVRWVREEPMAETADTVETTVMGG